MRSDLVRKEVDAALAEVDAAERSLGTLLKDLRGGPRAEKVTITAALETAFIRLRTARATLSKVHVLVDEDPTNPDPEVAPDDAAG